MAEKNTSERSSVEADKRSELQRLLGNTSEKTFFEKHWESFPLELDQIDPTLGKSLLTIDHLEEILSYASSVGAKKCLRLVRSENGQIANNQVPVDVKGNLDIFEIYRLYYDGWTIIINSIRDIWRPIYDFANHLEEDLGYPIGVNLYFTPGKSQGFLPHVDGHDVFVLQIQGSKTWEVYDSPIELPMERQDQKINPESLGDISVKSELHPGQALYIPRGWVHQASTSDESSIHLTVGIHSDHWRHLVHEVLRDAEENLVDLRKSLPKGLLNSEQGRRQAKKKIKELLNQVGNDNNADEVFKRYNKNQLKEQSWPLEGQFAIINQLESTTLDTVVERRERLQCIIEENETEVSLLFSGNVVSAPRKAAPAFQFISEQKRFSVSELPQGFTDSAKLTLVKRLIREGLLRSVQ